MSGTLYIVATPIGNLGDISLRALAVLRDVDAVAAEDTRRSMALLRHFDITTRLISYHEHSSESRHRHILDMLAEGRDIALISDAGMPGIADPGEQLISDWISHGGHVTVVPGATAFLAGLVLSGLPSGRFAFEGFLPRSGQLRRRILRELVAEKRTLVFYEAPHRLQDTLRDLLNIFGDRNASISREITKMYEEVLRGSLATLLQETEKRDMLGEIVLVVAGNQSGVPQEPAEEADLEETLRELLGQGLKPAQAAKQASERLGIERSEAYGRAVVLSRAMREEGGDMR
ncbi:MAG TPA: 16S rRNA (cytidine(1402)-2'-O)-methyltransferase [Bacillota bacterium]|nr:16S rRNA (cytidine(1402)-2'-O)-methyltransferase [Bacillota bacterium]